MFKSLKKFIFVCAILAASAVVVVVGSVMISRILAPNPERIIPRLVNDMQILIEDARRYYKKHGALGENTIYANFTSVKLVKKDGNSALGEKIRLDGSPTAFFKVGVDTTCIGVGFGEKAGKAHAYIKFFTLGQVTDMPEPLCKTIRKDERIMKFTENLLHLKNGPSIIGGASLGD